MNDELYVCIYMYITNRMETYWKRRARCLYSIEHTRSVCLLWVTSFTATEMSFYRVFVCVRVCVYKYVRGILIFSLRNGSNLHKTWRSSVWKIPSSNLGVRVCALTVTRNKVYFIFGCVIGVQAKINNDTRFTRISPSMYLRIIRRVSSDSRVGRFYYKT